MQIRSFTIDLTNCYFQMANPKSIPEHTNFGVWTPDTRETVLHLILKKSLARSLQSMTSGGSAAKVISPGRSREQANLEEKYARSLEVVLDLDDDLEIDYGEDDRYVTS